MSNLRLELFEFLFEVLLFVLEVHNLGLLDEDDAERLTQYRLFVVVPSSRSKFGVGELLLDHQVEYNLTLLTYHVEHIIRSLFIYLLKLRGDLLLLLDVLHLGYLHLSLRGLHLRCLGLLLVLLRIQYLVDDEE